MRTSCTTVSGIPLDAFVEETQKTVTGLVRVKLFKGRTIIAGRKSPFSLYNTRLATYTEEDTFDHKASEGFIKIFGLPTKTYHQVQAAAHSAAPAAHSAEVFTDAK